MLTPRTAELFKGRVGHQKSNFSLLIQRNGQFVTLFAHWKVKASMRFAPNQQSTKTSNYYRLQIVLSILMQRWSGWYWIGWIETEFLIWWCVRATTPLSNRKRCVNCCCRGWPRSKIIFLKIWCEDWVPFRAFFVCLGAWEWECECAHTSSHFT